MDILTQVNRNAERTLRQINKRATQNLEKANRGSERALEQANKKASKSIGLDIKHEGRVRVDADLKRKIYEKCNNKCHYKGCNIKDKNLLHIHHIDMKNNHTYLSNLELLCPTHHKMKHNEAFRKRYVSRDMLGRTRVTTRLVTKEKNKEFNRKKKARAQSNLYGDIKIPKFNLGI